MEAFLKLILGAVLVAFFFAFVIAIGGLFYGAIFYIAWVLIYNTGLVATAPIFTACFAVGAVVSVLTAKVNVNK